ncbi:phage tail tip fiber protein, partial [Aeromonas salmonicida]
KSGVVKNDQAIASLNKSFAESQTQVQSKLDEQMAIVNTKATTEFTAKGEGYATWDVNAGVWYNKTFYKAGMVISAEVKAGKVDTYIGFMANNFAFINPTNGKFETFMYMKEGQIFMKETFIDKAWLNSVVVTDKMTSANYDPGKVGFNIDAKTGDAEFNKLLISGDFKIVGDAGRVLVDGTG